jgi:hypothetical protein
MYAWLPGVWEQEVVAMAMAMFRASGSGAGG